MKNFNRMQAAGFVGVVLVIGLAGVASAAPQAASSAIAVIDDGTLKSQIAASLKDSSALAPREIDVDVKHGMVTLKGTVRTADEKTRAGGLAKVNGVTSVDNRIEVDPKVDQSKIDAAGDKTKSGLTKAVDATAGAAEKTKEGVQKAIGKSEQGVGKAADKTSEAAGSLGDKMSDSSVTTRVKADFSKEVLLRDTTLAVDTKDHVVTLKGTVASTEAKKRAAAIAASVEGVARVVDQLVVRGIE